MKEILSEALNFNWTKAIFLQWGELVLKRFEMDCFNAEVQQDEYKFNLDKQFVIHTMGRIEEQNVIIRQLREDQRLLHEQVGVLVAENRSHNLMVQNMLKEVLNNFHRVKSNFVGIPLNDNSHIDNYNNISDGTIILSPIPPYSNHQEQGDTSTSSTIINDTVINDDNPLILSNTEKKILKLMNLTTTSIAGDLLLKVLKDYRYLQMKEGNLKDYAYPNDKKFEETETPTKIAKFHSVMKYLVDGPFMSADDKKWYKKNFIPPYNRDSIEHTEWTKKIVTIHSKMLKKLTEILQHVFPKLGYHLDIKAVTVNNLSDNFNENGKTQITNYLNPQSEKKSQFNLLSYCTVGRSTTKFSED